MKKKECLPNKISGTVEYKKNCTHEPNKSNIFFTRFPFILLEIHVWEIKNLLNRLIVVMCVNHVLFEVKSLHKQFFNSLVPHPLKDLLSHLMEIINFNSIVTYFITTNLSLGWPKKDTSLQCACSNDTLREQNIVKNH